MEKIVIAKNLTKDYITGEVIVHAIKGINFEIEPSTMISFVGPSGSGKSTILNLIGVLDSKTSGELTIFGTDVSKLNREQAADFRAKNLGFIFQDFNLIPILTVLENVEYPLLMLTNMSKKERLEKCYSLLEQVELTDQANKYPNQLSGGQKQRVAIARALVLEPKLVLADEPTANLDHETAYKILDVMLKMKNEMKTSFVFSTHDEKIMKKAELLYILEDGKLIDKKELKK